MQIKSQIQDLALPCTYETRVLNMFLFHVGKLGPKLGEFTVLFRLKEPQHRFELTSWSQHFIIRTILENKEYPTKILALSTRFATLTSFSPACRPDYLFKIVTQISKPSHSISRISVLPSPFKHFQATTCFPRTLFFHPIVRQLPITRSQ
jgi:hypothetical protein